MGVLRILTFHRVDEPARSSHLNPRLISALPGTFTRQMEHLARRYRVVTLGEVLEASRGGSLPRQAVLITFDDAYRDFQEVAWPVLKRLGLPVTLFVPTAYPGSGRHFWWDRIHWALTATPRREPLVLGGGEALAMDVESARLRAVRRLQERIKTLPHGEALEWVRRVEQWAEAPPIPEPGPVLGWEELRRLTEEGVTLGAHTRTHPLLTRLPADLLEEEIAGSLEELRENTGQAWPIFCYPDGAHNEEVVQALRRAGVELAFTTRDGHNRMAGCDLLRLRRTHITPRTTPTLFALRLRSWFVPIDRLRHSPRVSSRVSAWFRAEGGSARC